MRGAKLEHVAIGEAGHLVPHSGRYIESIAGLQMFPATQFGYQLAILVQAILVGIHHQQFAGLNIEGLVFELVIVPTALLAFLKEQDLAAVFRLVDDPIFPAPSLWDENSR